MLDFLILTISLFFFGMAVERICKGIFYIYEANRVYEEKEVLKVIDEPAEVIDEPKTTKERLDEIFDGVEVDYSGRFYE